MNRSRRTGRIAVNNKQREVVDRQRLMNVGATTAG
jgi:hypothetical protein